MNKLYLVKALLFFSFIILVSSNTSFAQNRYYKLDYMGYAFNDGPRFEDVNSFYYMFNKFKDDGDTFVVSMPIADTASIDVFLSCTDFILREDIELWYPYAVLTELSNDSTSHLYGLYLKGIYDFTTKESGHMTWDFWCYLRKYFDPYHKDEVFNHMSKFMKKKRKLNRCGFKKMNQD